MCRLSSVIPWKMRNSFSWHALLVEGTPTWGGCQVQSGSCAAHSRDFIMSGWHLMCSASWSTGSTDCFPLHNKGTRQPISSTSSIYCTKVFKTLPENSTTIQKCSLLSFPKYQVSSVSQHLRKGTVLSEAWTGQRLWLTSWLKVL